MNIRFNKILSAVALAAATTLTTSCDSLFNDAPINKISEKSIWKTRSCSTNTRTHGIAT